MLHVYIIELKFKSFMWHFFSGNQNSRSSPRSRAPMAEGIYNNSHFLHAAAAQVGNSVRVKTKGGVIVEGIFRTFSEDFHVSSYKNLSFKTQLKPLITF